MSRENKDNSRKLLSKKQIIIIVIAIVLVAAVISAVLLIQKKNQAEEGFADSDTLDKLVEETVSVSDETDSTFTDLGVEDPGLDIDWDALKAENEDIIGWIYIPDTQVNYPILRHPSIESYYLNVTYDGQEGYPGSIYIDCINSKDFTDRNTVIYGYNMSDGSMLGSMHLFEDKDFFDSHPYVYIYTPDYNLVYEVFAAYVFSNLHILKTFDCTSPLSFEYYIETVPMAANGMNDHLRKDISVTSADHIISISTSITDQPENRWITQAVLLNPEVLPESFSDDQLETFDDEELVNEQVELMEQQDSQTSDGTASEDDTTSDDSAASDDETTQLVKVN